MKLKSLAAIVLAVSMPLYAGCRSYPTQHMSTQVSPVDPDRLGEKYHQNELKYSTKKTNLQEYARETNSISQGPFGM